MPDTEWLDEHVELHAIDALPADENERFTRELADLSAMERRIYDGRITDIHTTMADYAAAYAVPAPASLRQRVIDHVFADPRSAEPTSAPSTGGGDLSVSETIVQNESLGASAPVPHEPPPGHGEPPTQDTGPPQEPEATDQLAARRGRRHRPYESSAGTQRRPGLALAAAAAVAVVALGVGVLIGRGTLDRPEEPPVAVSAAQQQVLDIVAADDARMSSAQLAEQNGTLSVITSASSNRAVAIVRDRAEALPADSVFQLWLVGKEPTPVSAGLIGDLDAEPLLINELDASEAVAITIEPTGGSAQPTTDILGQISLAE